MARQPGKLVKEAREVQRMARAFTEEVLFLQLPNGRAVVAVAAYNYTDTSIGPYGEIPVGIPVTLNSKKSRLSSLMPLLKESHYPGFGILVMHLPVTKV